MAAFAWFLCTCGHAKEDHLGPWTVKLVCRKCACTRFKTTDERGRAFTRP